MLDISRHSLRVPCACAKCHQFVQHVCRLLDDPVILTLILNSPVSTSGMCSQILQNFPCVWLSIILAVLFILLDFHLFTLVLSTKGPLPLYFNKTNPECYASPFCKVDIKTLFLDWLNFYIYNPISTVLYDRIPSTTWLVVTADHISLAHVILAFIAAKLVSNDSIWYRRLGVLTFELRNFLDSFDGVVARGTLGSAIGKDYGIGSTGYYIDGFADLAGCLSLGYGCWVYSKSHPLKFKNPHNYYNQIFKMVTGRLTTSVTTVLVKRKKKFSKREDNQEMLELMQSPCEHYEEDVKIGGGRGHVNHGGQLIFWFGTQGVLNSFVWNRYIATLTRWLQNANSSLLESKELGGSQQLKEAIFLREFMTLFIIFVWRIINIHAFMELLIIFIFLDKLPQLLIFTFYYGWFPLLFAISLSEIVLLHGRFLFSPSTFPEI